MSPVRFLIFNFVCSKLIELVSDLNISCYCNLIGVIRLVQYLSQNHLFGKDRALKIVVDSGTGTTAVGLGLGALCLG